MRGLFAAFFFFFANLSFYLVMTMFMQRGLQIPPLQAGSVFLPLALAFRHRLATQRHAGRGHRRHPRADRGLCGAGCRPSRYSC